MCDLWLAVTDDMYDTYVAAAEKYNGRLLEERDSGFDVFCEAETYHTHDGPAVFLKFGIVAACAMKGSMPRAYWLMPRSSISKTPLSCANSIGLIDSGYRGALMGAVRSTQSSGLYTVTAGTRLFQLVAGSAKPWSRVNIVRSIEELPKPNSERGAGGFGSTGTH